MKVDLSDKEAYIFEHVKHILSNVFQTLLIAFLITLLLRAFFPIEVDSRVNINWFMIAVIVTGALSILFPPQKEHKHNTKITSKDFVLIGVLGIFGTVLIFLKLNSLGWISYPIALLGGIIIVLLSYLVLTEQDTPSREPEQVHHSSNHHTPH